MRIFACILVTVLAVSPALFSQSREMMARMDAAIQDVPPRVGEPLPDVVGFDEQRQPFNLKDLKGSYAVIISGCLT